MNITKNYSFILIGLTFILGLGANSNAVQANPEINKSALLERHNFYRNEVGVPPLEWSNELAEMAQVWANELAINCELQHSNKPFGENIYWNSNEASEIEVVDNWASEKRYFNHSKRVFRESETNKVGHYTQIVWRNTKRVGGAKQKCRHGGEIWVCNYDPAGNWIDSKVY